MPLIVVDVEADGPCPGLYSMVCFGAVVVEPDFKPENRFYGKTCPISELWKPEALAISGFTREQHEEFPDPLETMRKFEIWIKRIPGRPIFISDNPAFDWQFINYYCHSYLDANPFGFSARRIGDLWCGLRKDARAQWKHLRKTKHTHDPVDDALGNCEALLEIAREIPNLL